MEGFRARKGVLITTSSFSREAEEYVSRIERKIVLIGGVTLAQLMIDHNIGVSTSRAQVVIRSWFAPRYQASIRGALAGKHAPYLHWCPPR
jgi:hypothetical protein